MGQTPHPSVFSRSDQMSAGVKDTFVYNCRSIEENRGSNSVRLCERGLRQQNHIIRSLLPGY